MRNRALEQAGKKQERGLATSAIGMSSILLAGLGIDSSRFYLSKAELQNAADASALAVSGSNSRPGITASFESTAGWRHYHANLSNIAPGEISHAGLARSRWSYQIPQALCH
jgi:uncharacterized membrane protein